MAGFLLQIQLHERVNHGLPLAIIHPAVGYGECVRILHLQGTQFRNGPEFYLHWRGVRFDCGCPSKLHQARADRYSDVCCTGDLLGTSDRGNPLGSLISVVMVLMQSNGLRNGSWK